MSLENPADENFNLIKSGAVIKADTNIGKGQLFRIYEHEKTDSGVTAVAYPIFFDAARETFLLDSRPTNKTGQQALDILFSGTRYSGSSDILIASTAYWKKKNCIEAMNSDDDNSFLSRWGGEPIYNNYHVTVNNRAGGDYGNLFRRSRIAPLGARRRYRRESCGAGVFRHTARVRLRDDGGFHGSDRCVFPRGISADSGPGCIHPAAELD